MIDEDFAIRLGWRERFSRWDESKHPRDEDGKFAAKAGDRITAVNAYSVLGKNGDMEDRWIRKSLTGWGSLSGKEATAEEVRRMAKEGGWHPDEEQIDVPTNFEKRLQVKEDKKGNKNIEAGVYVWSDGHWWREDGKEGSIPQHSEFYFSEIKESSAKYKSYEAAKADFTSDEFRQRVSAAIADHEEHYAGLDAKLKSGEMRPGAYISLTSPRLRRQRFLDQFKTHDAAASIRVSAAIGVDPSFKEKAAEVIHKAYGRYLNKGVEIGNVAIAKSDTGRAHAKAFSGSVHLTDAPDEDEIVHEVGHLLERDAGVAKLAVGFLQSRASRPGMTLKPLNEILGDTRFRDDEMAYVDAEGRGIVDDAVFSSDYSDIDVERGRRRNAIYCGKVYAQGDQGEQATEVVAMGMETLFRNPVSFAKADPEYFGLMVAILNGDASAEKYSRDVADDSFAIRMGWREKYAKDLFGREVGGYGGGSIQWDESKHPRDDDGKFTDKGRGERKKYTPGETITVNHSMVIPVPDDMKRPGDSQYSSISFTRTAKDKWIESSGRFPGSYTDAQIQEIFDRYADKAIYYSQDLVVPDNADKTIEKAVLGKDGKSRIVRYTYEDGFWNPDDGGNAITAETAKSLIQSKQARIKPDSQIKRKHDSYSSFKDGFLKDADFIYRMADEYRQKMWQQQDITAEIAGKMNYWETSDELVRSQQKEKEIKDEFRSQFIKPKKPHSSEYWLDSPDADTGPEGQNDWRHDAQRREKVKHQMEQAGKFYSRYCEKRDFDGLKDIKIIPTKGGRASCATHVGMIRLHDGDHLDDGRTAIHEIAHLFEREENTAKVANEFLQERVRKSGAVLKTLNEMDGGDDEWSYEDDEVAYFTPEGKPLFYRDFGGAYASKKYDGEASYWHGYPATEVTTMGVQSFYQDPINFAIADPEFFALTVAILKGEA